MIISFACKYTEKLASRNVVKKFPVDIQKTALRKLRMIHAARSVEDLRIPPANSLEKLKRDRRGQYSIRVNSQWRVCFEFKNGNAFNVEIVDYH